MQDSGKPEDAGTAKPEGARAVIERDGEWFVAWSPEIPGANGHGRSVEECLESLGSVSG